MAVLAIPEPQRTKKSARTGKRIGQKHRPTVSITVNDHDRNVSRLWELLKLHYSRERMTAAELGRMVFLRGAIALLEEIELRAHNEEKEEMEKHQERLF